MHNYNSFLLVLHFSFIKAKGNQTLIFKETLYLKKNKPLFIMCCNLSLPLQKIIPFNTLQKSYGEIRNCKRKLTNCR